MIAKKILTYHKHEKGRVLAWMALIMGTGVGLNLPMFPNYVKSIVGTDIATSIFYATTSVVVLIAALLSTIIFKKIHRTTITKTSLIGLGLIFIFFIFATRITELAIINTLKVWFNLFLLMTLALFVRDFAKEHNLGEKEGRFYTFSNIGYLIGPLLGGFLASIFDYEMVFILSALIFISGFVYFYHQHVIEKHPSIIDRKMTTKAKLIKNTKDYFKNINRTKAYLITCTQMAWYGFKRLYIPLFVVSMGYVESMSGLIMSIGIIPFILMEVRVGKYADKHGVKNPLTIGFLIMGITTILVFFSPYPLLSFALIILSSIGGALVEPLQEFFLFKNLPEEQEDNLYGIYMTADPIAFFIVPAIGAAILFLLPFKFIFLVFGGIFMLASLFAHTKLKHS
ncbi:MAG: MFS transporter [Candidatus Peregrinibacteria bacterium]